MPVFCPVKMASNDHDNDDDIFITQNTFQNSPVSFTETANILSDSFCALNAVNYIENIGDEMLENIAAPHGSGSHGISDISDNELVLTCERVEANIKTAPEPHYSDISEEDRPTTAKMMTSGISRFSSPVSDSEIAEKSRKRQV